jgi:hypothetical protein
MTASAFPLKSLREKMAENPAAYDFGQADQAIIAEIDKPPIPLSMVLGAPGEPITRRGLDFYPDSPPLLELDDMFAAIQEMGAEGAQRTRFQTICNVLTFILHVKGEDGELRRATFQEVGSRFKFSDMDLLTSLLGEYCGIRQQAGAEGNVSPLPTTPTSS